MKTQHAQILGIWHMTAAHPIFSRCQLGCKKAVECIVISMTYFLPKSLYSTTCYVNVLKLYRRCSGICFRGARGTAFAHLWWPDRMRPRSQIASDWGRLVDVVRRGVHCHCASAKKIITGQLRHRVSGNSGGARTRMFCGQRSATLRMHPDDALAHQLFVDSADTPGLDAIKSIY